MKLGGRQRWMLGGALLAAASCATGMGNGPGTTSSSASSASSGHTGTTSSSSSSSSSGGGTGGTGGTGGCTTAADCPASTNPCVQTTCAAGMCGSQNLPMGTVLMADSPPDCMGTVCDGTGNAVKGVDEANVVAPTDPCLVGTCDMSGTPGTAPGPAGTACASDGGAHVCDGAGNCVECVHAADCPGGQACSATNICVPMTCADGVMDGDETDVDCGGGACPPCALGKMCLLDPDCASDACDAAALTCVADPCSDHRKDGDETDVDCGGSCPTPCAIGEGCAIDGDCITNACDPLSFTCDASQCMDNRQDGDETDVDCGGATCVARCAIGQMCKVDTDCVAPFACDGISLLCVANQCSDHRQDGNETDVDCGGADACVRCAVGMKCLTNGDCRAGHACSATTLLCQ